MQVPRRLSAGGPAAEAPKLPEGAKKERQSRCLSPKQAGLWTVHIWREMKKLYQSAGVAPGGFPTTRATCLLGLLFLGKGPVPAGGYFRPFQRQRHTHLHRGKRHGPRPAATGAHRAHHNTRSIMLLGNRSPTSLWGKIPSNQQPPSPRNRKTGTKNQVGGRSFFPGFIFMGIFGPAPINPGTFQIQIQGLIYGSYKTLGTFLSFHSVV